MADIPNDVLVDILSRLSVKSLMRFKCVCKTWRSLISDTSFGVLQWKQSDKNSPHKILLSTSSRLQSFDCSAITTSFGGDGALRNLDFPYKRPDSIVHLIGSCNGLVCVALDQYEQFFIWNPSTGAYRRLPQLDIPSYVNLYSYGFGYDSSTNDYKVLFATRTVDCSINDTEFNVFATRTNTWRRFQLNSNIQCCDNFYWQRSRGSLVNGRLHWLTRWYCDKLHRNRDFMSITAFDFAGEELIEVPTPAIGGNFSALGVIDGCLCVIKRGSDDSLELWMMMEYGAASSWTKLYNFGNCREVYCSGRMVPLCCTKLGDGIMLNNGNELIRWNPKKRRRLQHLMITSKGEAKVFHESTEATAYVESLLSPNVSTDSSLWPNV